MKTILRRPLILWDPSRHDDQPYTASIIFRRDDPYAVTILIPDHDTNKMHEVVIARALLIDGLMEPTGELGFAYVEPHAVQEYVTLTLPLRNGLRELYAERVPLESFRDATCRMVPLPEQRPIAQADLERWLAGVAA
ncbi:SsgA family sporulation/cell division regulator [Nonomuraea sp. NPDC050202]|uniref:SsgA family sporulation/cell division regulator n=1 Tax=Nonomuraea sp. NPDC050202 TaxID=3155035 RepID=UPI0033EB4E39